MIRRKLTYFASIACMLLLVISSSPVRGEIIWSEDFEDDDLEGWDVYGIEIVPEADNWRSWEGNASVSDGTLNIGGPTTDDWDEIYWTVLQRDLDMDYGTWSFDYSAGNEHQWFNNLFITNTSYETQRGTEDEFGSPAANIDYGLSLNWKGAWEETEMLETVGIGLTHPDYFMEIGEYNTQYDYQDPTSWQHFEISRYENNSISLAIGNDEETFVNYTSTAPNAQIEFNSFNYLILWVCSGVKLDNFVAEELPESSDPSIPPETNGANLDGLLTTATVIGIGAVAITVGYISKKKLGPFLRKRRIRRAQFLLKSFADIFSIQQLSYLAVLGQRQFDDQELSRKLSKEIPPDLKDYKFLMSPIRLSIIKLLYKNYSLTSTVIKNSLNISWGDYKTHINALVSKGFISVHTEFQDGLSSKVVYLEEEGRQEYESLLGLLKEFLHDAETDFFEPSTSLYPNHVNHKP